MWSFIKNNKIYTCIIGICIFIILVMQWLMTEPAWIEYYYSRGFYPKFSYLSILLFSWIPFSFGDIFYFVVILLLLYLLGKVGQELWYRNFNAFRQKCLQVVAIAMCLYVFFYINWGLNYYRIPLVEQLDLSLDLATEKDYEDVLEKYILIANDLRETIDLDRMDKLEVRKEMEEWMRSDSLFDGILSKSQIHVKEPLSSVAVSYFLVSGYFNPFTQEVQVNQEMPKASYPFTLVHELSHQMGIGLEDECNYIAFRKLLRHKDAWYRYAAYYEAIQYLLYPVSKDKAQYEKYKNMFSAKVKSDFNADRQFWNRYKGWINSLSQVFYNGYLKHNNQPEGIDRYGMMAKLVVAWELSNFPNAN